MRYVAYFCNAIHESHSERNILRNVSTWTSQCDITGKMEWHEDGGWLAGWLYVSIGNRNRHWELFYDYCCCNTSTYVRPIECRYCNWNHIWIPYIQCALLSSSCIYISQPVWIVALMPIANILCPLHEFRVNTLFLVHRSIFFLQFHQEELRR